MGGWVGKIESQSLLEAGWLELNALGLDETFKSLSQSVAFIRIHRRHKPKQVPERVQKRVLTQVARVSHESARAAPPEPLSALDLSESRNSEGDVTR